MVSLFLSGYVHEVVNDRTPPYNNGGSMDCFIIQMYSVYKSRYTALPENLKYSNAHLHSLFVLVYIESQIRQFPHLPFYFRS